jgi:predicted hydrolase (HD superfamily)
MTTTAAPEHGEKTLRAQRADVADKARHTVAAHCEDAGQFSELALILGLVTVDPHTGSYVAADPWDTDAEDQTALLR